MQPKPTFWKRAKTAFFILIGKEPIPKKAEYAFSADVKVIEPEWVRLSMTIGLDFVGDTYLEQVYVNAVEKETIKGSLKDVRVLENYTDANGASKLFANAKEKLS